MKNYFNYKSFFSNFQISKIIKESKISLKCHYLKYFIYFSLNKIFQFGLFLMTKLSIIMIYCSKVVVLFFWPLNPSHHPCEKWILLILMIIKHTTWQWEHAWLQYNPILSCKVCVDLLDTIFSYFSRKMWNG